MVNQLKKLEKLGFGSVSTSTLITLHSFLLQLKDNPELTHARKSLSTDDFRYVQKLNAKFDLYTTMPSKVYDKRHYAAKLTRVGKRLLDILSA